MTDRQKSQKMENQTLQATWTTCKRFVRKLDMNITGEQAHWIKYGMWSCKKKKKENKKTDRSCFD